MNQTWRDLTSLYLSLRRSRSRLSRPTGCTSSSVLSSRALFRQCVKKWLRLKKKKTCLYIQLRDEIGRSLAAKTIGVIDRVRSIRLHAEYCSGKMFNSERKRVNRRSVRNRKRLFPLSSRVEMLECQLNMFSSCNKGKIPDKHLRRTIKSVINTPLLAQ